MNNTLHSRTVTVAGIGETLMGRYPDRSIRDMIQEAGAKAIADSGIDVNLIQAVYVGNFAGQQLAQQGHIGSLVGETLGLLGVPTMRLEAACVSGGLAFLQGIQAIRSGLYDVVLVGGVEKMTHQPTDIVTSALATAMDAELEASSGLTFPGSFAMIANRYFHEFRDVRHEMAQVAVSAHDNALLNPHAQMRKAITIDDVLSAPRIADPFGLFDCSLVTDGAAFMVLTTEEIARQAGSRNRVVTVSGAGHGGDALTLHGKKSMTSFAATKQAAAQAYAQAGLGPQDIDLAEVHDCFTITQIINTEDLGFFEPGTGADAVATGRTSRLGDKPINVSGGLKAKGHPIGATGISQAIEIVTQLRGDAQDRQIPQADIGLTHNLGGTAGTCVVTILEGE